MPKTDHTSTTSARYPASPGPRLPSKPAPIPGPAKPSRRGVMLATATLLALGSAVAGTASAAAAAVPVADDPDAILLALCEEYTALDRASLANSYASDDLPICSPEYEALSQAGYAMVPRLHELEGLIAATPPLTDRGCWAKLEATRRSMVSDGDNPESSVMGEREVELAHAVVKNMLDYFAGRA